MKKTEKSILGLSAALLLSAFFIGEQAGAQDARTEEAAKIIQEVRQSLSAKVRGQLNISPAEGIEIIERSFHAKNKSSSLTRCFRRCEDDLNPQVNIFIENLQNGGYELVEEPETDFDTDWRFKFPLRFECKVALFVKVKVRKP